MSLLKLQLELGPIARARIRGRRAADPTLCDRVEAAIGAALAPGTIDPRVERTPAARRRVCARDASALRRDPTARRFAATADQAWERVAPHLRPSAPLFARALAEGLVTDARCAAALRGLLAKLDADARRAVQGPLDLDEEAVCAAMLWVIDKGDSPVEVALVDYWCVVAGPAFALEALARGWSFEPAGTYAGYFMPWWLHDLGRTSEPLVMYPVRREFGLSEKFERGELVPWHALRLRLIDVDRATRDAVRAAAERALATSSAPFDLRAAIAYAWPDEPRYAEQAADEVLQEGAVTASACLLGALRDGRRLEAVARAVVANSGEWEGEGVRPEYQFAHTMVDAAGVDAVPALRALLRGATPPRERREVAEALAIVRDSAAVCAELACWLADDVVGPVARRYLLGAPEELALPALRTVATTAGDATLAAIAGRLFRVVDARSGKRSA